MSTTFRTAKEVALTEQEITEELKLSINNLPPNIQQRILNHKRETMLLADYLDFASIIQMFSTQYNTKVRELEQQVKDLQKELEKAK